jgi:hypothetical protein
VIALAYEGLERFNTEKEVAQYVRKAFVDKVRAAGRLPAPQRAAASL